MSELNEKSINYGNLNRFLQDLRSHDLSDLEDKIDNIDIPTIPEYTEGEGIMVQKNIPYFTVVALQDNTNVWCYAQNENFIPNIQYSTDLSTWSECEFDESTGDGTTTIIINAGDKVYFRGKNPNGIQSSYWGIDDSNHFGIGASKPYNLEGNLMALIDWETLPTTSDYDFSCMFYEDYKIIDASKFTLGATTLASGARYNQMFYSAEYLEYSPIMPATILPNYIYVYMYYGCNRLKQIICLAEQNIGNGTDDMADMGSGDNNGILVKSSNATWTDEIKNAAHIPLDWMEIEYQNVPENAISINYEVQRLLKTINDKVDSSELSNYATQSGVTTALAEKANKVDFVIPVDMQTQVVDWTALNNAAEGIYRVKVVVDMMGTSVTMMEGWATVTNSMGTIAQTLVLTQMIPNSQGSPLTVHNRVSTNGGTTWSDYEFYLGVINDNNSSSESTYSSSKIDSLISALDQRITALGG